MQGAGPAVALPPSAGAVVTDASVPEGHRGLHGFLYGEAGAEVHDQAEQQYHTREVRLAAFPLPSSICLGRTAQPGVEGYRWIAACAPAQRTHACRCCMLQARFAGAGLVLQHRIWKRQNRGRSAGMSAYVGGNCNRARTTAQRWCRWRATCARARGRNRWECLRCTMRGATCSTSATRAT